MPYIPTDSAADAIMRDIRATETYIELQDALAAYWSREARFCGELAAQAREAGDHALADDLDIKAQRAGQRREGYVKNALTERARGCAI